MQKEELASKRPLVPVDVELPENEQEVLATFRVAAALGRQALGAYVISMASQPSDMLAVVLLQKEARLQAASSGGCALHCTAAGQPSAAPMTSAWQCTVFSCACPQLTI